MLLTNTEHTPRQLDSDSGTCLGHDEQNPQDISPQSRCTSALHRRPTTNIEVYCSIHHKAEVIHSPQVKLISRLAKYMLHFQNDDC